MSEVQQSVESSPSVWQPSETQRRLGIEGYLGYLGGHNMYTNPFSEAAVGIHGFVPEDVKANEAVCREVMALTADAWIVDGLTRVIRNASPTDRGGLQNIEPFFEETALHMLNTVARAYSDEAMRIEEIGNPSLNIFRPFPFEDRIVFGFFCHGRLPKIDVAGLLGGFASHAFFGDPMNLHGRTLRTLANARKGQLPEILVAAEYVVNLGSKERIRLVKVS